MYKLGMCYYNGQGVPQDFTEAVKLFVQADLAEENPDSQYMLGMCWLDGEGVEKRDEAQAKVYFEKSAAQGNEYAQTWLRTLQG